MEYPNTLPAVFLSRKNRFVAAVLLDGKEETVHVKNTGRLGELLTPGADVILQDCAAENRKTRYDLICVRKPELGWVNIDSQATNKVMLEWLQDSGFSAIRPEYRYGESRLDFYAEKDSENYLIEVKGCTLELGGIGYFPDAPSERAVRHLGELMRAKAEGCRAVIAFVIAMPQVTKVLPYERNDPAFAAAFRQATEAGVEVWYLPCSVTESALKVERCLIENEKA
ncbi:MAG: DNA/RNA nuclease SfsA [Clostridia bacterium]|nr:DNA/RNA nuclease SfsA [Clostridia bacterium]